MLLDDTTINHESTLTCIMNYVGEIKKKTVGFRWQVYMYRTCKMDGLYNSLCVTHVH